MDQGLNGVGFKESSNILTKSPVLCSDVRKPARQGEHPMVTRQIKEEMTIVDEVSQSSLPVQASLLRSFCEWALEEDESDCSFSTKYNWNSASSSLSGNNF
jgi:hypothetical protein